MKQDDDNTDQDISDNTSEDSGEYTLSSDIEEDYLDNLQKVIHLDQAHCDKTLRTIRVSLPKKHGLVDTVIARTSLLNMRHLDWAIAPPLFKRQKSTINILRESDVVADQALPLHPAGGGQNIP
jgi:hypothetical protein